MEQTEALTVLRALVDSSGHPEAEAALTALTGRVRELEQRAIYVRDNALSWREEAAAHWILTGNEKRVRRASPSETGPAVVFTRPVDEEPWPPIAEALRKRPGEWAKVRPEVKASSIAHKIRTGQVAAFRPAGEWEAKALRGDLWVRYVGQALDLPDAGIPS